MTDKEQQDSLDLLDELKAQIIINKHELDEELIHQPHLFMKVAEQYAIAVSYRDEARQKVKTIEASLDRYYRQEALRENEKLTEKSLESRISIDLDFRKANEDYLAWKGIADTWQAIYDSYAQRSHALHDLAQLYIAGYFSNSSASGHRADAGKRVAESVLGSQTEQREATRKRLVERRGV